MHRYFIKTPWWVRRLFSSYVWHIPTKEKVVYLTFDDGPHPAITPWVLDELKKYNAKATFFCIGNNVVQQPATYQRILAEGHAVGNHTHDHLNGWKTSAGIYLDNVTKASSVIASPLFRPPYGKITSAQARGLSRAMQHDSIRVIMWDVLSADFDRSISPQHCIRNVLENIREGSVIVFHDSEKAFRNLEVTLPFILNTLSKEGYKFEEILMDRL